MSSPTPIDIPMYLNNFFFLFARNISYCNRFLGRLVVLTRGKEFFSHIFFFLVLVFVCIFADIFYIQIRAPSIRNYRPCTRTVSVDLWQFIDSKLRGLGGVCRFINYLRTKTVHKFTPRSHCILHSLISDSVHTTRLYYNSFFNYYTFSNNSLRTNHIIVLEARLLVRAVYVVSYYT